MNKPNWKDAPEWANYVAMDADGEWWWFEFEPRPDIDSGVFFRNEGKYTHYFTDTAWFETLERRP